MKKLFLLSIVFLAICGSQSAANQDSVTLLLRKKAYERFHEVKDTVTVRTWMNMDRMNKALIQVVEYDNQLLESYEGKDSSAMISEKSRVDKVNDKTVIEPRTFESKFLFPVEYVLAAFIALTAMLLIFLIVIIRQSISLRKLKSKYSDRDDTFDPKLNRLEFLENEVKKMKIRENEVKAELEKGIVDYQEKMQTLRKRIEELANENTRLENLNTVHSERKVAIEDSSNVHTEETKQEIFGENEGILKRVKKVRK
jgi:hypothetical protein